MARGRKVNLSDVTDMVSTTKAKKDPEWYQYVEEIASIGDYPDALEYEPDEGESLRKLRVRVTKAANSQEIEITHRETARGTLLVFRPPTEGTRRGRRKRQESGE
jgi:broad specificity phosphatase PhoE